MCPEAFTVIRDGIRKEAVNMNDKCHRNSVSKNCQSMVIKLCHLQRLSESYFKWLSRNLRKISFMIKRKGLSECSSMAGHTQCRWVPLEPEHLQVHWVTQRHASEGSCLKPSQNRQQQREQTHMRTVQLRSKPQCGCDWWGCCRRVISHVR